MTMTGDEEARNLLMHSKRASESADTRGTNRKSRMCTSTRPNTVARQTHNKRKHTLAASSFDVLLALLERLGALLRNCSAQLQRGKHETTQVPQRQRKKNEREATKTMREKRHHESTGRPWRARNTGVINVGTQEKTRRPMLTASRSSIVSPRSRFDTERSEQRSELARLGCTRQR